MEIYNTITLPNGGTVAMDKLAYATYEGGCVSTHKSRWKVTIEFENEQIETATVDETTNREYR